MCFLSQIERLFDKYSASVEIQFKFSSVHAPWIQSLAFQTTRISATFEAPRTRTKYPQHSKHSEFELAREHCTSLW